VVVDLDAHASDLVGAQASLDSAKHGKEIGL
jgi:hypothetical protein